MSKTSGAKSGFIVGEGAKPPFAVVPNPSLLFHHRAETPFMVGCWAVRVPAWRLRQAVRL